MLPGKGVHLVLNEDVLGWVRDTLSEVATAYDDEVHDADPKVVVQQLCAPMANGGAGWESEKDSFGVKAIAKRPYKKGELRVTVVLTKQNELKLDIREWYEPQE
jgi:hypothetical protein